MEEKLEDYLAERLSDIECRLEEVEVYEVDNLAGSNVENYEDALMRLREIRSVLERIAGE